MPKKKQKLKVTDEQVERAVEKALGSVATKWLDKQKKNIGGAVLTGAFWLIIAFIVWGLWSLITSTDETKKQFAHAVLKVVEIVTK